MNGQLAAACAGVVCIVIHEHSSDDLFYRFLIGAVFTKAKLGAACAGVVCIIMYIPYMYVGIREDAGAYIPMWAKFVSVSRTRKNMFDNFKSHN